MSDVLERFLRYSRIDTQSDPKNPEQTPSTQKQFDLAHLLAQELKDMGAQDVSVDEHCYTIAQIPASAGCEDLPRLALIAHVDSSPDACGTGCDPRVITYEGGDIVLEKPADNPAVILAADTPDLATMVGKELVVSDGTTLIAADDKAGVAEIMALAKVLLDDPTIPHPPVAVCFPPDEEIGHGAELLDLEKLGAAWAYTIDGGPIGEIEFENFNGASAVVEFFGTMVHPGYAKDVMVNAIHLYDQFAACLPAWQRPEHTGGYDGFFHAHDIHGDVEHLTVEYIIRDHDIEKFQAKKAVMEQAAGLIDKQYGPGRVKLTIKDQYYNMSEKVKPHMFLIDNAHDAFAEAGFTPTIIPIRGGTDGAQLSFRGLPCPNLSAGGYNFHSVREFVPVYALEGMVDVLKILVGKFACKQK